MFKRIPGFLKAATGAVLLMAMTQSCQKSVDQQASTDAVSEAHVSELKSMIANMSGTAVSNVSYNPTEQSFYVSGDAGMVLSDAEAYFKAQGGMKMSSATQTEQKMYSYLINQTKVRNINIAVDASVPSDWISILDQALANWNNSGSAVHFTRLSTVVAAPITSGTTSGVAAAIGNANGRKKTQTSGGGTTTTSGGGTTTTSGGGTTTTSGGGTTTTTGGTGTTTSTGGGTTTTTSTTPDIIVRTFNNNATSTIAQAYYPDNYGNPGFEIDINLYYTYLTTTYKIFALTHELGHNLGLTHTDQSYGTLIPGTPDVDANSVMNSVCLPWNGFTFYDVTAIKTLYPY